MRRRRVAWTVAAMSWIAIPAASAEAGQQLAVEPAPVEMGLGVTINSVGTDVNAPPACLVLEHICTRAQPGKWGGFGADLTVDTAVSRHVAITALASIASFGYDTPESLRAHRTATNVTRVLAIGPTLRTTFTHPAPASLENDRFFVQVLAGIEDSTIFDTRPTVQVGVGVDTYTAVGRTRTHHGTVRLELSYRFNPGAVYPRGGFRAFFGAVFGPHV